MGSLGPFVSVVIPAFNAQRSVLMAVASVLRQSYSRLEVIVVDDGSTDATFDSLSAVSDERLRVIRQENTGAGGARNAGMNAARGELISFIDADDFWLPSFLQLAVAELRRPRQIVTSNGYYVFQGGLEPVYGGRHPALPPLRRQREALLRRNWVCVMSLFPRSLFEEIGGFDVALDRAEDWEFWLRAVFSGWEVVLQPIPQGCFDRSVTTRSGSIARLAHAEDEIMSKMAGREDVTRSESRFLDSRLAVPGAGSLLYRAEDAVLEHDYRQASDLMSQWARLNQPSLAKRVEIAGLRLAPGLLGPVSRRRRVSAIHAGRSLLRDDG